jgi:hypothetical protein
MYSPTEAFRRKLMREGVSYRMRSICVLRDCGRLTSVCERFYSLLFPLRAMQVQYLMRLYKALEWSGVVRRAGWLVVWMSARVWSLI